MHFRGLGKKTYTPLEEIPSEKRGAQERRGNRSPGIKGKKLVVFRSGYSIARRFPLTVSRGLSRSFCDAYGAPTGSPPLDQSLSPLSARRS